MRQGKQRMRAGVVAIATMLTSGCGERSGGTAALTPSAAAVAYSLPTATPKLSMQLVLLGCGKDGVLAAPVVAVVNEAGADPKRRHRIEGSDLSSALTKRDLAIELYEAGTLKSVNAAVEDRTGAVVANVFNLLGSALGLVRAGSSLVSTDSPQCNKKTMAALQAVEDAEGKLQQLREDLLKANPADTEVIQKRIDTLAALIGSIRSNELSVSLSRKLEVSTAPGEQQKIRWRLKELAKWFGPDPARNPCAKVPIFKNEGAKTGCDAETDYFAINYRIDTEEFGTADERADRCLGPTDPAVAEKCRRTLVLVEPAQAKVTVTATDSRFPGFKQGDTLAVSPLLLPQWGKVGYFPLEIGLGGSKSLSVGLNQFGDRSTFSWKSAASAEGATGAVNTALTAANQFLGVAGGANTAQVAVWQGRISELETQLKLNKLVKCESVIQAGGTTCPE